MRPETRRTGARAIFVLGLQRSGTTWVANMLHGSGAVAAIAAEDHRGVHESLFFSHFATAFGPLDDPASRKAFHDAFAASDYWLLSELPADMLVRFIEDAPDHHEVFAAMMDRVADEAGAPLWLEKSPHHTLLSNELADRFPAARFICVTRDSRTLILSRLSAYGRTPPRGPRRLADILRGAMVNALHTRHLDRFCKSCDRAIPVHYDTLAAEPEAGRSAIVDGLNLPVPPDALQSRFAPNTSHDRGAGKPTLGLLDRVAVAAGDMIGAILPLGILASMQRKRRVSRGIDWPQWVWRRSGFFPSDLLQARTDPETDYTDRNHQGSGNS